MDSAFASMCAVSNTSTECSEGRTLRRRRSVASAALLSRPSMLTLGELVPSIETCVLVYISSLPSREPRVVYALFEPNFLVNGGDRSVRKLDRAEWERLRSHVEDLRIVALSSRYQAMSPMLRKPDCMFDLSCPTDPAPRGVISLHLQPQSYAVVPARCKTELLQIEIHTPSDADAAQERTTCLPAQVRTILHDADELTHHSPTSSPLSPPTPTQASTCDRIIQLVSHY